MLVNQIAAAVVGSRARFPIRGLELRSGVAEFYR